MAKIPVIGMAPSQKRKWRSPLDGDTPDGQTHKPRRDNKGKWFVLCANGEKIYNEFNSQERAYKDYLIAKKMNGGI